MPGIDLAYVTGLVPLARAGDMNAFAEIYAATCQKQYAFAVGLTGDEFTARACIEDAYAELLTTLPQMRDDALIVERITLLTLNACLEARARENGTDPGSDMIDMGKFRCSVRSALTLPYTEGLALVLCAYLSMRSRDAGALLEIPASYVRANVRAAKERLALLSGSNGGVDP